MHPKLQITDSVYVNKKWGAEKILFNNSELCGKILTFRAGSEFSSHMHVKKYEFFYVLRGSVEVIGINTEDSSKYTILLKEGDTLEVPRLAFHKIRALEYSEIVEFSTQHEDSDSYRVEAGDSQKIYEKAV